MKTVLSFVSYLWLDRPTLPEPTLPSLFIFSPMWIPCTDELQAPDKLIFPISYQADLNAPNITLPYGVVQLVPTEPKEHW